MLKDAALLESQIDEVLKLPKDEIDPLEVAALAGLLARIAPEHPAVARARALLEGELSDATDVAIVEMPIEAVAESLFDEDLSWEERFDRMLGFDELCAAAWFADAPERAARTAAAVAAAIHDSADTWCEFSADASAILAGASFDREDPAHRFWAAVEAAMWRVDVTR